MAEDVDRKLLKFFSAIADETRLKILRALMDKECNVNEIYEKVGREKMTLSAISHQLKQLEDMGIISYVKRGREKYFNLSEGFCWCILKDADRHFGKKTTCAGCADAKKHK
ncbi:MAG: metalloregulator ArsR/SmtB family transcription factor [archaeon]